MDVSHGTGAFYPGKADPSRGIFLLAAHGLSRSPARRIDSEVWSRCRASRRRRAASTCRLSPGTEGLKQGSDLGGPGQMRTRGSSEVLLCILALRGSQPAHWRRERRTVVLRERFSHKTLRVSENPQGLICLVTCGAFSTRLRAQRIPRQPGPRALCVSWRRLAPWRSAEPLSSPLLPDRSRLRASPYRDRRRRG